MLWGTIPDIGSTPVSDPLYICFLILHAIGIQSDALVAAVVYKAPTTYDFMESPHAHHKCCPLVPVDPRALLRLCPPPQGPRISRPPLRISLTCTSLRRPAAWHVPLDLFGAPARIRLAHIGGRLDGGDELKDDVRRPDQADDGSRDDLERVTREQDGADEDVDWARETGCQEGPRAQLPRGERGFVLLTDTATKEGEKKRGVARDLGRNLELCVPTWSGDNTAMHER